MSPRLLVLSLEAHPSSRLRIGQYLPALEQDGYSIRQISVRSARMSPSALRHIGMELRQADVVFIQRIASFPLNAMLRLSPARVIYDVDDALHFVRAGQIEQTRFPATLRQRLTVRYRESVRGSRYHGSRKRPIDDLVSLADTVIVGNAFLRDQLARHARDVIVLPTCVPVDGETVRTHEERRPIRIGWIGTRGNLLELKDLEAVFADLSTRFGKDIVLTVISSAPYETQSIRTEFLPWSLESESSSLLTFDIGIMPLGDALFARGKCAFKAIQYMSRGVPAVVSPVGMNTEVVQDGVNGYLAGTSVEWVERLSSLARDAALRARLGQAAFEKVQTSYSTDRGLRELRRALGVGHSLLGEPYLP